jgi:hypothetical protein
MISQVSPEEFGSAYQNGKARVQVTLTIQPRPWQIFGQSPMALAD